MKVEITMTQVGHIPAPSDADADADAADRLTEALEALCN